MAGRRKAAGVDDQAFIIMFFSFVAIATATVIFDRKEIMTPALLLTSRIFLGIFFIGAGMAHFDPKQNNTYVALMPPFLPNPELLHKVAGAFEVIGGAGVLVPMDDVENAAAWLLICTLWAVFPANIYCLFNSDARRALRDMPLAMAWIRIPIQFIFMEWVRVHTQTSLEELLGL
mmetsp:Transcript_36891/g.75175  ORF Transcript_36891/g.75175 Transcript_36891/m.75175 type:complete len:175 (-) Transcript_36891:1118-1642(-)